MTTDREMAMRVHLALGGSPLNFPGPLEREAERRLVAIGRELDRATRRDVAAEVVAMYAKEVG